MKRKYKVVSVIGGYGIKVRRLGRYWWVYSKSKRYGVTTLIAQMRKDMNPIIEDLEEGRREITWGLKIKGPRQRPL